MESSWWSLALLLLPFLLLLIWTKVQNSSSNRRPPGPTGWLVVGNMFDLGTMPHKTLYKLRFKYGPILWLKFGLVNTMVIQSPKAAEELFKNHDSTFCDRKIADATTSWSFNQGSLVVGNYGTYW
ncbi:hypothetical protein Vadar_008529 [Vaccinium darrowii]|nr:hypothetical protein Vadar_008529 [Vaccinium darrowii]